MPISLEPSKVLDGLERSAGDTRMCYMSKALHITKKETMQIRNNTSAFNVWKNYTNSVGNLRDSMSKLSSGSRINNADDDSSGLALSERLRTQSRNTAAAAGKVENKLSYLLTADSRMQKIYDRLGHMGELATMANDGTKSATDKDALQKEFQQLQNEIERIADMITSAGRFNGLSLFQAVDDGGVGMDLSAASGELLDRADFMNLTDDGATWKAGTWGGLISSDIGTQANGLIAIGSGTEHNAGAAITAVNAGIYFISTKRADVGAEMKRMEQTLDGLRSYEENISATESRIRDVDVAKEAVGMSKYNILQQVGAIMQAQTNPLPQGALQLFG